MANTVYQRFLQSVVQEDLTLYPVVAVMGARQVGKSTLCRRLAEENEFAHRTLDDGDVLQQALESPEALLDDLGDRGVFIDEVQRAPNLLLAVKGIVDREQRPGHYLLSGSNQPRVTGAVAESLLGRAAYRTLRPLTLSELRLSEGYAGWDFLFGTDEAGVVEELEQRAEASGQLDWRNVVRTGGFPRVVNAPAEHQMRLLNDYVETFSRRDIQEVLGIESAERFENFLRLVNVRSGQVLNHSSLSADLAIPVNTIRRWIDALLRSYLVELIPPYFRNAGQRVIKAPKLFAVDCGLAMAAARESEPSGFHLETLVANDLAVWKDGAPGRGLFHWRLAGGQEVDFVLQHGTKLVAVEVKAGASMNLGEVRHLRKFRESHPNAVRGILLSSDATVRALSSDIIAAPWWSVI